MSKSALTAAIRPVSELRQTGDTPFLIEPEAEERKALAERVGAENLRKVRFEGKLTPKGKRGFELTARLGATATQSCIVTLEPVTTRIDTDVVRRFVPADQLEQMDEGAETEMPEDDSLEPLGEQIDLSDVLAEALALALPSYPRKDGAELGEAVYSAEGTAPLTDADIKPFAGLAALRDKMQDNGD